MYSVPWRGSSKGHSLDSFHYTLSGNPLNELNGSVLPLATPANSQLWPTNSGQLARVGIVINQFMPLPCKIHFQLWPKTSDTSTSGQSAKSGGDTLLVDGQKMDCIARRHTHGLCKTNTQWPDIVLQIAELSYDIVEGTSLPAESSCLVASSWLGKTEAASASSFSGIGRSAQNTGAMPSSI